MKHHEGQKKKKNAALNFLMLFFFSPCLTMNEICRAHRGCVFWHTLWNDIRNYTKLENLADFRFT